MMNMLNDENVIVCGVVPLSKHFLKGAWSTMLKHHEISLRMVI